MSMTAAEQYILELVNRARLDPAGEAARLGIDLNEGLAPGTISAASKDPLASNDSLQTAARGHSVHMDAVDLMAHSGIGDGTDIERMQAAGYTPVGSTWYGENIAWVGTTGSVDEAAFAYQNYANLFIDTFDANRGHRLNMLSETFREIGVGEVVGTMRGNDGVLYNAAILTQDFGSRGTDYFVSGVAYNDTNGNRFYDIGEARGGVTVSVGGVADLTEAAGGYAVAYAGGAVSVVFSGGGLPTGVGVVVQGGTHSVKVDLIGTNTVAVSQSATLGANAANLLLLGVGALNGFGNAAANSITGTSGSNVLSGAAGADTLSGGAGMDTLLGGEDNDILNGGAGGDRLDGGNGADTAVYSSALAAVRASLATPGSNTGEAAGDFYISIEGLSGSQFNDQLLGNTAANTLNGLAGNDTMSGGLGNDVYVVDSTGDVVSEAANGGTDLVRSFVSRSLGVNQENLTLLGASSINGSGNADNNVLTGNAAANTLNGLAGNDTMAGGGGNDIYVVDSAGDIVSEAANGGIDLVRSFVTRTLGVNQENLALMGGNAINGGGNGANNSITGNSGANLLNGGGGVDTVNGGGGNDTVLGGVGAGQDRLFGGIGSDRFDFNDVAETAVGATRDVIHDFEAGTAATFVDRIDLAGIDANALLGGNQAFAFIAGAAFTAGVAGQVRAFQLGGGQTLIQGNTDGDVAAEFEILIANSISLANLTAIDFVL